MVRSRDRTIAITVIADRGPTGRETSADDYARMTLNDLPGFEGSVDPTPRRVPGSPYASAQVQGRGRLPDSRAEQRITVAAFTRVGKVTYTVVAFRQSQVPPAVLERLMGTVRGG